MAFGKRSVVSNNIWDFSIGLIGESGIGKTTVMSAICEKLLGADGYILLNIGKEWGVSAIGGITYEDVPDYKTWDEITRDIIKNKATEYPNLKVVIADTLDQLVEIIQPYIIDAYNHEHIGEKDFKKATTISAAYAGFGRGEDKVIEVLLKRIEALRNVGVMFWFTGHTKSREIVDPLSGVTYTSLTTNMMQRYFNAIKTKTDVLGVACIDRDVVKEGLGRKDIVTKKEVTRNKVVSESRKIKFRDESYCVDSKSRFAGIMPEILLDSDEFINALNSAIQAAGGTSKPKPTEKKPSAPDPVEESPAEEITTDDFDLDDFEDMPTDFDLETYRDEVRAKYKAATDKDVKAKVRAILAEKCEKKLDNADKDVLDEISALL